VLGDMPKACPVSTYFQKFSIYLKTFENPDNGGVHVHRILIFFKYSQNDR
jgi:hypothetical protein